MRKIGLISIFIFIIIYAAGCSTNMSEKTDQELLDEHMIAVTVNEAFEKAFNYHYDTTTGLEGSEYFTERYSNEVQATKENQEQIIKQRKEKKIIAKIQIDDGIYDIIINENQASATANYQSDFSSTDPTYDGKRTGKIEVNLIKKNGKWLIDGFQFYHYQD